VEVDEELKGFSANDITCQGVQGITLTERLLLEIPNFRKTGGHLDLKNTTLCTSSRDPDGYVPRVDWLDDKLHVYWSLPVFRRGTVRARAVVS